VRYEANLAAWNPPNCLPTHRVATPRLPPRSRRLRHPSQRKGVLTGLSDHGGPAVFHRIKQRPA